MRATIGVVFNAFYFGRNAVLVATEVDHAVVVLVTATDMPRCDVPIVVAPGRLRLFLN